MLVSVALCFTFPVFTGKVRFPVDFAGPAPGQVAEPLVNPELGDPFFVFYPWHSYLGHRLGQGELPLWDPYRFGGTPFAADISTGTWYPPNWLYASGHILASFTLIAVASIFGALFLAYWFFRVIELHPYAAVLGAVVFVFSAFMMKWSANEHVFGSSMWLPLALGGIEVARRGRVRRGVVLAGIGLALAILAGQAQIALYVWLATFIWASLAVAGGVRATPPAERRGWLVRNGAALAGAFAIGLGLAAIQLLPTAQFSEHIIRQKTTFDVARTTALPIRHIPTLLLPDYLGSPLDGNYAGPGVNYTETAWYAGLLTLPLAAVGLFARRRRYVAFFAIVTAIGLLATFGTVFYRAVLLLPGFDRTFFVVRFILFVNFGLAGLAALGLHSLLARRTRPPTWLVLAPVAALVGVLVLLMLAPLGTPLPRSYVRAGVARAIAIALVGGLLLAALLRFRSRIEPVAVGLVALVAFDLWLFAFPFTPYLDPQPVYGRTQEIDLIADAGGKRPRFADLAPWWVPPNGALAHRIYGIEGYGPLIPTRMVELVALAEDQTTKARGNYFGPFEEETFRSPIMDLLGIRTVTGDATAFAGTTPSYVGRFALFDRPSAFPPAFLASCWETPPGHGDLDRLRTMTAEELRSTVVLDRAPSKASGGAPVGGAGGSTCQPAGQATVARYEPERVVVDTQASGPSILVLTDAWYPGWEARVDGKKVDVLRADHALRAVALPAGSHQVEFEFRPRSLEVGAGISGATAVVVVGWLALVAVRARRRRIEAEG